MKFTDGFWQLRPGVTALYAQEAYDIDKTDATPDGAGLVVTAPTKVIASRGDVLAQQYIQAQMEAIGLQPGAPDGGWLQKVPLVGTTVKGSPALTFRKGAEERRLAWRDDYVAWTKRTTVSGCSATILSVVNSTIS